MAVLDPELDVATAIASRVSALTIGASCFAGPVRPPDGDDIPAESVFVLEAVAASSPLPMRGTDAGSGPDQIRSHRLQIRIRSNQDDYAGGASLARSVRDAIVFRPPPGYGDIEAIQAAPVYIGKDNQGCHEWSINVDALAEETTT